MLGLRIMKRSPPSVNLIKTHNFQPDEEERDKLRIENITHADEGWYTCVAANSLGTTAAKAYLHVVDGKTAKLLSIFHNLIVI